MTKDSPRFARFGRIGFGSANAGNLYTAIDDATAQEIFTAAWDLGIRYFDTSPHYGQGLAERRLGRFLAGVPREEVVVSAKVGRLLVPNPGFHGEIDPSHFDVPNTMSRVADYSREGVRRSLASSLERLGLDRVDAVYVHDPEQLGAEAAEQHLRTGIPAVCELRDEGVVQLCGVGTGSVAAARRACELGDIDVVMIAGRWSLLDQSAAGLLDECERRGIAVLVAGPYQSGILATDPPQAASHYDYGAVPAEVLARARRLADVCHEAGTDLPTAALHFPLRHPAVTSLVLGAASVGQLQQNWNRLASTVPDELWADLRARGLTR